MARAALDWTVTDLSTAAGVGTTTIVRFERGQAASNRSTIASIERAFEAAGVRFSNGEGPGVRLLPQRPEKPLRVADLPTHDIPWDGSVSLRREDMYGDDGR